MYGTNKFKIAFVTFILIFLFMICAMYSTTKDQAESTKKQREATETIKLENEKISQTASEKRRELDDLRSQIETLNNKVESLQSSSSNFKCRVQGVLSNGQVDSVSTEVALQEAKNGEEIVLICSY